MNGYEGPRVVNSELQDVDWNKVVPIQVCTERESASGEGGALRTQIPLCPSYGMTIHKAQGQTLEDVYFGIADAETTF